MTTISISSTKRKQMCEALLTFSENMTEVIQGEVLTIQDIAIAIEQGTYEEAAYSLSTLESGPRDSVCEIVRDMIGSEKASTILDIVVFPKKK